jgi:hypothetical protein
MSTQNVILVRFKEQVAEFLYDAVDVLITKTDNSPIVNNHFTKQSVCLLVFVFSTIST